MVKANQYKIQYRVMLARYRGKPICPTCHGTRLKKEATYVKVGGTSITELVEKPITALKEFFDRLELDEQGWVKLLYKIRGYEVPQGVLDGINTEI
jgi:excinuclease ABC subunit A